MAAPRPLPPGFKHFYIIPEETILVVMSVIGESSRNAADLAQVRSLCNFIAHSVDKWPVSLEASSATYRFIQGLKAMVKDIVKNSFYSSSTARDRLRYLGDFFDFYDVADVAWDRLVTGNEAFVVDTSPSIWNPQMRSPGNPDGPEPTLSWEKFSDFMTAAQFKGEMLPHPHQRTNAWFQRRTTTLAKMETAPMKFLTVDKSKLDLRPRTEAAATAHPPAPTPTPAPPRPTPAIAVPAHRRISVIPNDPDIDVTQKLVFKSGDAQATLNIGSLDAKSPHNKLVNAVKEIWACLVEKELTDKVTLQDVVELSKKTVSGG
ncbi:hypothetical protein P154DRAFT_567475 [Amniculicola lignicola CBS 123094]|uniref:Uncharacterized protein n=1 Tax=Amniculicola lignicola CBS 123094 TaxID=1392246 RepID=A0A6A5VZX9_9PLEO|nr:hypothetical protein P154DRAFT_567475 [Amniculicola lignicola CBS 123094]